MKSFVTNHQTDAQKQKFPLSTVMNKKNPTERPLSVYHLCIIAKLVTKLRALCQKGGMQEDP